MIKTPEQKLSRNPQNAGYTNPLKSYDVPAKDNPDGTINVHAQPVYPIDPNVEPIPMRMPCVIQDSASAGQVLGVDYIGSADLSTGGKLGIYTSTMNYVYSPPSGMQRLRTPTNFAHALCTTVAATVVWDPAAGKKFRLMGYVICPDAGMAAAGIQLITLLDEAAAITIAHQTYLPIAASITHQVPIVVQLPGNGYLSVAADNRLSVTLTSACTAGAISVMAYGTEE